MSLTPELIHWLQEKEAAAWLPGLTASPPDDAALLATLLHLRKHVAPHKAAALVTQARLRYQARKKFGAQAATLFFTATHLQQASPPAVARHIANRYTKHPIVADLGCGMGADSLALAARTEQILAIDQDPLAVSLTQANARASHLHHRIHPIQADILQPAWHTDTAWADPGRRQQDSRRIFHPQALQPPLAALLKLQNSSIPHMGIKLMPGLPHQHIPPQAETEWISLNGQLKEAVLWLGNLAQYPGQRRATLLPAGLSLYAHHAPAVVRAPGSHLYEPDPAIIRAGAVSDLAQHLGLWQLDEQIAYLSGAQIAASPWARTWRILEHFPFDLKHLNRRLRALGAQVEAVKKRGSPIQPEPFRKRLYRRKQGRSVVVILTRVHDRAWMLITERE